MTAVLRGQAHLASAAYLCDSIDGGIGFRTNRGKDVREREALDRGESRGCGLVNGLLLLLHVWLGRRAADEDWFGAVGGLGPR